MSHAEMDDSYRLERFVSAQDSGGGSYAEALAELRAGRKVTHWMWYVFPQIDGLGSSAMARRYAISSLEEALAYLRHPVLGSRLLDAVRALLSVEGRSATAILGPVDAMKLRSSMTLFEAADPAEPVFREVLDTYFQGHADDATLGRLADD